VPPCCFKPIQARYTRLATEGSNLSCGQAASAFTPDPGQACVDLGCGRGADVLKLAAQVGPTGRVWGLDATPAMLEVGRARAVELGLTNTSFVESPLEALALPDACADWVVSNCALNHATDKVQVWKEIARVLKPGGRFVVSDIYAVEPIAAQYREDPVAVAECWAGAVTRPEYLEQISSAGLSELAISGEREPYRKAQATLASFTVSGLKPFPAP
jgi:ubiquinone/menaquinone biosynthesis C-methylase UbiE